MLAQISQPRLLSFRSRGIWPAFLALAVALLTYTGLSATHLAPQSIPSSPDLGKLPLSFEPNAGQVNSEVQYMARASGGTFYFTPSEIVLSLKAAGDNAEAAGVLRTTFVGASSQALMGTEEALPGKVNYLIGNDPADWRTNLPTYAGVTYSQLYNGIDLAYSGTEGRLKSTYTVAPGADPANIKWRYAGASRAQVGAAGSLRLSLPSKDGQTLSVTEAAPVAWQVVSGIKIPVSAQFRVFGDSTVGFSLGAYDKSLPLVIDPTLIYSTFLGGTGYDRGQGITIDREGNIYVSGYTASSNFPVAVGVQPAYAGGPMDAYVTKLNPSGSALIYSTFIGGNNEDYSMDIGVDRDGNAFITGRTNSVTFPISNAVQSAIGGSFDSFATKLNASGSGLVYSTYLGGSGIDESWRLAVDRSGYLYIAGDTYSSNFPLRNAYQSIRRGVTDSFLVKMTPVGALSYSTLLGGGGSDAGYGVAIDWLGYAYISGYTFSTDFPTTTGAFQTQYRGAGDAFIAKLRTDGSPPIYATYLGGSGDDIGEGMAVDFLGNAYVTGYTNSSNFPVSHAIQPNRQGGYDAFVTKIFLTGSSLSYSTYLGGSNDEVGSDCSLDAFGNLYVIGTTASSNFPTRNAVQPNSGGGQDAFVTKVNPFGTAYRYSTYLGGSGTEWGITLETNRLLVPYNDGPDNDTPDHYGGVYVTGETNSSNFPTAAPFDPSYNGAADAFVTKISDYPVESPGKEPNSPPPSDR